MRALVKTLSYGTMHLIVAIGVAYALTSDWAIALSVGIIEPMVQTVAYSLHERLWTPKLRQASAHAGMAPATSVAAY